MRRGCYVDSRVNELAFIILELTETSKAAARLEKYLESSFHLASKIDLQNKQRALVDRFVVARRNITRLSTCENERTARFGAEAGDVAK